MVPFIPRRGSPWSSPALFCRAGAAAWNAPQQLHPVVPGAQDAGWAAPGTWAPSGWAEFRPRGCSTIPRLLPGHRCWVFSPFPRVQGALCPFSACSRLLSWLECGAPSPFCGRRVLPDPFFQAQGASVPLGQRVLSPLPGHRFAPCPFQCCPIQGKPQGFSPALPSPRLPPACQRVRGVLLASLMLWSLELERLSLKPCPVGPGIMNIRTLAFYVNTY